jgi:2-polyprenyl-3-methyl-5-hydroxy-6-metoxy-1,4-benzoquinol methylase
MEKVTWTHPGIAHILEAIPVDARSLVDVGCGSGIIGALCRIYRNMDRQVGIDGYQPMLDLCTRHIFYDECLNRDITEPLPFPDHSFDVVTCIEVIEHVKKADGIKLLDELERVGRKIVVSTPNGFMEQGELAANPLQKHQSGWTVKDFTSRGYRVKGVGAMLIFGGHRKLISSALAPLSRVIPSTSELILCEKQVG